jgi:raffinose/stachyose/melibiose transport system substrate-binding protein
MRRSSSRLVLIAVTGALLAACSGPGAPSAAKPDTSQTVITAPVTAADLAENGDTTLRLWLTEDERDVVEKIIPVFQRKYPTVKFEVTYKSFGDLTNTAVNVAAGPNPPDVFQGNQGFQVDGALVKAGLIRPLDDIAKTYGWPNTFKSGTLSQFTWSDDGGKFGQGRLYGIAVDDQSVGLYYNKTKLARLGLRPPTSFQDLERALAVARAHGEVPVMIGANNPAGAQFAFANVLSQFQSAEQTRRWVQGIPGSTFGDPANRQAAETLQKWARLGYFGRGYLGLSNPDAVAKFASGTGLFFMGGNWQSGAIRKAGGASGYGYMLMPRGASGRHFALGSLGFPWHISARTKHVPAAAAFLGFLTDPEAAQQYVAANRFPLTAGANIDSPDPLYSDQLAATRQLIADDGEALYMDWTTSTMPETLRAQTQELMAGKTSPEGFVAAVQENWAQAHGQ